MNSVDVRVYARKYRLIVFMLLHVVGLGACNPNRASALHASGFRVALLTPGPVSDAGWNAAAYEGLELIKNKLDAQTALVQTTSPADFEDSFRDFASRGFNLVFAHGFEYTDEALKVAQDFPNTYFVVSSGDASSRNVASLTFNFDQATYVEGILAAGVSKTGVAGAIGGVELPSIKLTFEGFRRGFLSMRPTAGFWSAIRATSTTSVRRRKRPWRKLARAPTCSSITPTPPASGFSGGRAGACLRLRCV